MTGSISNSVTQEQLERAKGYPYNRPATSFIFMNSQRKGPEAYTFENQNWSGVEGLSNLIVQRPSGGGSCKVAEAMADHGVQFGCDSARDWTPVLAIGSNAGVSQLARKFSAEWAPEGVVVPVVQSVLEDFDVVYAPLISSYGSATATLELAPKSNDNMQTKVELFVTFLNPTQLQRMHATEGAYHLVRLDDIRLHLGQSLDQNNASCPPAAALSSILQYNHQKGTLHLPVRHSNPPVPIALEEIKAANRVFPELSQPMMQRAVYIATQDGKWIKPSQGENEVWEIGPKAHQRLQSFFQNGAGDHTADEYVPPAELHEWISRNLTDPQWRVELVHKLGSIAKAFTYDKHTVQLKLGTLASANVR